MSARRVAIAMVCLTLAAGACGSNKDSGNPGATKTSGGTSSNPVSLGNLKSGTAHLEVSGAATASVELPLNAKDSQYHAPPAGFAVFWKDDKNDLLSIGGSAFTGTRRTSATLVLGFNIVKGNSIAFATSSKGECSIKMTSSNGVDGSFDCSGLKSGDKTYDAKGTFSAKA